MIKDKTLDSHLEEREHLKLLSVTKNVIKDYLPPPSNPGLHTFKFLFFFHFSVGLKLAKKFIKLHYYYIIAKLCGTTHKIQ